MAGLLIAGLLLAGCGALSWRQDPAVRAADQACREPGQTDRYACIELNALQSLNPEICRLAGIAVHDMCLQAVYQAADDPAVCEQLYLQGVRPTCRAYYQSRARLGEPDAAGPVWHSILFLRTHARATELWTVNLLSEAAERRVRPEHVVQDPAVSPTGDAIAYVRVTGDHGGVVSELWLVDPEGTNPRLLYTPPAGQSVLSRPTWLPEGRQVAFLQHGSGTRSQLLGIALGGGQPTTILTDCLDYALSPDGALLVGVDLERRLAMYDLSGEWIGDLAPQNIRLTDLGELAFSPSAGQLAFRATEPGIDTWNLYVMDWSALSARRLTDLSGFHPATAQTGQVNGLSWTENGGHLVYSVDGVAEHAGIWLISLDGLVRRRLYAGEEGEWAAVQGPWYQAAGRPVGATDG
jgi:hypothetical protein